MIPKDIMGNILQLSIRAIRRQLPRQQEEGAVVEARSIAPYKTGLIFPDCLQLQCVFSLISASGVANHVVMLQLVIVDSTAAPALYSVGP